MAFPIDENLARLVLCKGNRHEAQREVDGQTVKDGLPPQAAAAANLVAAYRRLATQTATGPRKRQWILDKFEACHRAMRQVVYGGVQPTAAIADNGLRL